MEFVLRAARLCTAASLATLLLAQASLAADTAPTSGLSAETLAKIDAVVSDALKKTAAPSASIAIVRDGRTVYLRAYGDAKLEPKLPAEPGLRYAIGSISKQFTAAAILLLQQDGKLSLDDKVARFLPTLTRANDITIRQLLSHTAGYQDYWPQDYMFPLMVEPVAPEGIMDRWARKPLDYEPGTKCQYSNTGFVIAGRIIEKASGKPLFQFLQERIFTPLQMTSVRDFDTEPLAPGNVTGYVSYALGPPRVIAVSGAGWLFGAAQLAMTAEDLARWDISMMDRSLLSDASYRALETAVLLTNGASAQYGLGVHVEMEDHRRKIMHGGAVNGFTSENTIYPDDRAAITVLVNQDSSPAPAQISGKLGEILLDRALPADEARTAQARAIFDGLQQGRLERSLFTANASFYFTQQAIDDFRASLAPLGAPTEFKQTRRWLRGGMTGRSYDATFAGRTLRVTTLEMPDGKLEQFTVAVRE